MQELRVVPLSLTVAATLLTACLVGWLLIVGKSLLIPIVIALLIWHFLNAIEQAIRKIPKVGHHLPTWFTYLLTLIIVSQLGNALFNIISNNVQDVINAAPRYQIHIQQIASNLEARLPLKLHLQLNQFFASWSLQPFLIGVYGVFSTITSSAVLIGLYVVFLFVEQHFFSKKLHALLPQSRHRAVIESILKHVVQDTQAYLGIKTALSLLTAFSSWLIMHLVGLDFAAFWALLIFFLNFIPNIGAMIATAFPVLLALIQFQTWLPCFLITGAIVSIQFIVGNLLEPRFLSKSLNVSPLIILIALAFWGSLWGILGMFLSVPITVMLMIIFAHFESTRPIAVMLSQDGCIQKNYDHLTD